MLLSPIKFLQLIGFVSVATLMCGCKTTVQNKQPTEDAKTIAIRKLGSSIESFRSPDGHYELFVQQPDDSPMKQALKFLVIQINTNMVVMEKSFMPGYVKWMGDSSLELLDMPGIIRGDEDLTDYKKIIDVAHYKN
jgi:hypothetical protein